MNWDTIRYKTIRALEFVLVSACAIMLILVLVRAKKKCHEVTNERRKKELYEGNGYRVVQLSGSRYMIIFASGDTLITH